MSRQIPGEEQPTLDAVERGFARGDDAAATELLLHLLDTRAAGGDPVCALAAQALRRKVEGSTFAPDTMATAVDRLVHLAREQETQIRALRAIVESGL